MMILFRMYNFFVLSFWIVFFVMSMVMLFVLLVMFDLRVNKVMEMSIGL